jgi:hypothetical protein
MPIEQQVVVVYAATKGYLDKVSTSDITAAEAAILKHVDPAIYKVLRAKQKITPELNAHMQVRGGQGGGGLQNCVSGCGRGRVACGQGTGFHLQIQCMPCLYTVILSFRTQQKGWCQGRDLLVLVLLVLRSY